jgi:hypothetical protein
VVRRPHELDVSVLAGHSRDLGFETVSTRQRYHAPRLRFLMLGDSWVCRGQLVSFAIAG